ncbi:MAG TPA: hypothetical protein VKR06_36920 [Ktedonosporobacter sp.]|nr:hypothetical protein [Ktedonosporobacter sp.]
MGKMHFQAKGTKPSYKRENRRLKRDLERVQQERDIRAKSCGHLFAGSQMRYQFIEQHKQEFPIVVMCRVLDVSESGFYAWRKRPPCQHQREDAQLDIRDSTGIERSSGQIRQPAPACSRCVIGARASGA